VVTVTDGDSEGRVTHLEVQDDRPDEAQRELRITCNRNSFNEKPRLE
jgi:hypothetical protein